MDPHVADVERFPEKLKDEKEGWPSFHCDLYDTEVVHKIAQVFLPGLATACVDNTTGDIFRSPGSVAADIRKEMIDYLTHRSESFVAEHIVLEGGSEAEASNDPLDIISDFIDDFATSKRNLFSRVSSWLLSEKREDNIDDFAQEMEINGFWLMDHRESIAQTLLKNVDFRNGFHCEMNFKTQEKLAEHVEHCGYRSMHCENEGCNAVFCSNQMENHDSVCPFKIIPCEQNCSESIMRRQMDRHCITVCPMKLVNCPFYAIGCVSGVPQCELQQHRLDHLSSHLMYVLRGIYKKASTDDLIPRVEQIQQLSTQLAEAKDARSLTHLVKDIDPKLGPLVMQTKEVKPKDGVNKGENDTTDLMAIVSEETLNKALELDDDANESKKGLADVSEGDMKTGVKDGGLNAEEARETEGINKEREETNGFEVKVTNNFDEEGAETKKFINRVSEESETETPPRIVMDKKNDEATQTMNSTTLVAEIPEIEVRPKIVMDKVDDEKTLTINSATHASEESEIEAPPKVLMDKADEEETHTINSTNHASKESETEVPPIHMDKVEEKGTQTVNTTTNAEDEAKTEAPSIVVMEKADDEGIQTVNSTTYAEDEAKTEAPSTMVMEKADDEGIQTMNISSHASEESKTEASQMIVMEKACDEGTRTMNSNNSNIQRS